MVDRLYRFRPLEHLLGKDELKNREIFFAHPNQLNDPMEGLRDIFFQGDKIVWKNLFRHYLVCLDRACSLLAIGGEDHSLKWRHLPVLHFTDPYATPQHKALVDEVVATFFSEPAVQAYLKYLPDRPRRIRPNELAVYLRALHLLAVSTIYGIYEKRNLVPPQTIPAQTMGILRQGLQTSIKQFEHLKRLEKEEKEAEAMIDALFTATGRINHQLELLHKYNGDIDPTKTNKNFVFLSFFDDYVGQIENLVYPEWYTACFTSECNDASIWGAYSYGHTGVCLIFKVTERYSRPTLRLHRMNGWNNAGPTFGYVDHEFFEVKYDAKPVEVDFFRSLGRVPIPMRKKYWYYDEAGERSPTGEEVLTLEDEWRRRYWDNFNYSVTTKLEAFSREKEHRLVITARILDYWDENLRKAKYDFSDLEGIIFGIKTPEKEKIEISRIIEDKCRSSGRFDFKFYQAVYSRQTGTIKHAEMGLLKFKSSTSASGNLSK
jgi:hypothetical protein